MSSTNWTFVNTSYKSKMEEEVLLYVFSYFLYLPTVVLTAFDLSLMLLLELASFLRLFVACQRNSNLSFYSHAFTSKLIKEPTTHNERSRNHIFITNMSLIKSNLLLKINCENILNQLFKS